MIIASVVKNANYYCMIIEKSLCISACIKYVKVVCRRAAFPMRMSFNNIVRSTETILTYRQVVEFIICNRCACIIIFDIIF